MKGQGHCGCQLVGAGHPLLRRRVNWLCSLHSAVILIAAALCWPGSLQALEPTRQIDQYGHDLVPRVVIEAVVADGKTLPSRSEVSIATRKYKIEFHYTSLSLRIPARVRFKYKLEGYDRDWVDAGTRRVAYYTNLLRGNYRFHVIACNDDGVWNEEGASVLCLLKPPFYQTVWFFSLCCLAGLVTALAAQRLYTARLRRRAEQLERLVEERTADLQRQKSFLRQVIDITPNCIFVKDRDSRYTLVNQAMANKFSSTVEDMVGKTAAEAGMSSEAAEAFRRDDIAVMETRREKIIPEEPNHVGDKVCWVHTVKRPLINENGLAAHVLCVSTDISDRKAIEAEMCKAKEAAEAASRSKSEFLANMSHEIRTPMNGVLGMVELALDTDLTAEQRDYLGMVKTSAEALLTVINDVLDFSKIEAGKLDLDPVPCPLRELLVQTLTPMALRAVRKGLELTCEVDPEVPEEVLVDPARLRQILVNLAGNATKFTDRGEVGMSVCVESRQPQEISLHFCVSDTGIGVSPDHHKIIFEAFSQADGSTARRFGGTGLGLTISSRLVAIMGGRIWLESEVGKGSRFHFTIPVRAITSSGLPPRDMPSSELEGLRALVVDDNATSLGILGRMLERWGLHPVLTSGATQALAAFADARQSGMDFELFLVDADMPEMSGFDLLKCFRELGGSGSADIVMLSSAGQRSHAARCRELEVGAYLAKPIAESQLLNAVVKVSAIGPRLCEEQPLADRHPQCEVPPAPMRVLLVEDNAVNSRLASLFLEKRGHLVSLAANGREALDALRERRFEVIVTDISMPEMDGLEMAAAIRFQEKATGTHIPIVAMTAHAMQGDRERCFAAGMDGYISKPIQAKELFEAIEGLAAAVAG